MRRTNFTTNVLMVSLAMVGLFLAVGRFPLQAISDEASSTDDFIPSATLETRLAPTLTPTSPMPVVASQDVERPTQAYPMIIVSRETDIPDTSAPLTQECLTDECTTLTQMYGFEGIYGYVSPLLIERLDSVLESYSLMLGAGDIERGQIRFKNLVSGTNGFQRIEFVRELRSGRGGNPFARFAPEATPETGSQESDVFAVWCPLDQLVGVCDAYDLPAGTILVDISTSEHREEIDRTIAHELTHALDTKSEYDARQAFVDSGAAAAGPVQSSSLQENFAETIALWLFPRTGNPETDWDAMVGGFIQTYLQGLEGID